MPHLPKRTYVAPVVGSRETQRIKKTGRPINEFTAVVSVTVAFVGLLVTNINTFLQGRRESEQWAIQRADLLRKESEAKEDRHRTAFQAFVQLAAPLHLSMEDLPREFLYTLNEDLPADKKIASDRKVMLLWIAQVKLQFKRLSTWYFTHASELDAHRYAACSKFFEKAQVFAESFPPSMDWVEHYPWNEYHKEHVYSDLELEVGDAFSVLQTFLVPIHLENERPKKP